MEKSKGKWIKEQHLYQSWYHIKTITPKKKTIYTLRRNDGILNFQSDEEQFNYAKNNGQYIHNLTDEVLSNLVIEYAKEFSEFKTEYSKFESSNTSIDFTYFFSEWLYNYFSIN